MTSSPRPLKVTYHPTPHSAPPAHHVLPTRSSWLPVFSSPSNPSNSPAPVAFRNPWPSFRKRTVWDFVVPLRWDRPTEASSPEGAPEMATAGEQRVEHERVQATEERKERERGRKKLSALITKQLNGDGEERERGRLKRAFSAASFRKLSTGPAPPGGSSLPASPPDLKEPRERGRLRRALSNTSFSRKNSTTSRTSPSVTPPTGQDDDHELQIMVVQPDFGGAWDMTRSEARSTWLGHAGVLLQLPPLGRKGAKMERPVRVLFDPIFSARCSPTQYVGPTRYAPPPCSVADLPEIDCVFVSHNHYDHLDTDTITQLYSLNSRRLHFFVPLGLKQWFLGISISPSQITEMDWWDSATVTFPMLPPAGSRLRVTCTPAQHGSSRYGYDTDTTLWCSWVVEYVEPGYAGPQGSERPGAEKVFRAFFAGDTGLRYTDDWDEPPAAAPTAPSPISPSTSNSSAKSPILTTSPTSLLSATSLLPRPAPARPGPVPACPIFAELCTTLGTPDLAFLPISVGASLSYLRSYSPFPGTALPVPPVHLSKSFTSAIHMEAPDAVEVHRIFSAAAAAEDLHRQRKRGPVSVGIHFGTWCGGEQEVHGVVRELRRACEEKGVLFGRALTHAEEEGRFGGAGVEAEEGKFVVVNHGETIKMGF